LCNLNLLEKIEKIGKYYNKIGLLVVFKREIKSMNDSKTLRLILGDQLNYEHSWFQEVNEKHTYVLFEVRSETDYVAHHIQKVVGFFASMRAFSAHLISQGHTVHYYKISETTHFSTFEEGIKELIATENFDRFEYQEPDEYRVDAHLKSLVASLSIPWEVYSSEHFYTERNTLEKIFEGKKTYLMETFYRQIRKKEMILMDGDKPVTGQWNYDGDNRKKLPKNHVVSAPFLFENDVTDIYEEIQTAGIKTIGNIDIKRFIWPINRAQALELLDAFIENCLPFFGTFEDAMTTQSWSVYHSRSSFSMNLKILSPKEVIEKVIQAWESRQEEITYNQVEGFARQIVGWREFMRGIYWAKMPEFATLNFLNHTNPLPNWFWTGETKMKCLQSAINQSLDHAYAHHIQRLMVTGNFALLAGVNPDELDQWYLGIYIDALDWVEITNTRGMSQFADGGIIGTKPYVSSATYIDKMSNYCENCFYSKKEKVGEKACPFNSLYWHFYERHENKLGKNPRIGMMYNVWNKMEISKKEAILVQAQYYLDNINSL
jgi:deoxyribodipyrimidine photolyase-related protein